MKGRDDLIEQAPATPAALNAPHDIALVASLLQPLTVPSVLVCTIPKMLRAARLLNEHLQRAVQGEASGAEHIDLCAADLREDARASGVSIWDLEFIFASCRPSDYRLVGYSGDREVSIEELLERLRPQEDGAVGADSVPTRVVHRFSAPPVRGAMKTARGELLAS